MNRYALLIALGGFLVAGMVWPALRLWRRTGEHGLAVLRERDPTQRLMGALLGAWMAAMVTWAALYAWLGPAPLGVWPAPPPVTWAGWVALALGLVMTVSAQAGMGASWRVGIDERPTALVTGGWYALVRNPIYSAMLLALGGAVLVTPSPWSIMTWLGAAQLIALQVRLEEKHLAAQHGDAYRAWAARVGRFLPGVGRLG